MKLYLKGDYTKKVPYGYLDPIWEELDRKREEYIRIHGEVELDDDEEDE